MSVAIKLSDKYTYNDYLSWDDNGRWELIHGKAYLMSPAPTTLHQRISRKLLLSLGNFLKSKKCEVFDAPFDVRLPHVSKSNSDIDTVVQPDIVVICDKSKLDKKGCVGSPDLIIEIINPGTLDKDIKEKFNLYEENAVKEYWIVFPNDKFIEVFKLGTDNKYKQAERYTANDKIKCELLKGLTIDLKDVFEE